MDEIEAKQAGGAERFQSCDHEPDATPAKKIRRLIVAGFILFFGNTLFVFVPALFESLTGIVVAIIDYILLLSVALELWSVGEKRTILRETFQPNLSKSRHRGIWFNSGAYARLTAIFALVPGLVILKTLKYQVSREMLEYRTAVQTGFLCFVLIIDIWALCFYSLFYRRTKYKRVIEPSVESILPNH